MMIMHPPPTWWWLCTLNPPDDDDAPNALHDVVPGLEEADEDRFPAERRVQYVVRQDLLAAVKYQDVSEEQQQRHQRRPVHPNWINELISRLSPLPKRTTFL